METGLADRFISPVYAAPEQLRGDAITTDCDIYALGVLLRLRAVLESRRGNYAERNAMSTDLLARAERLYGHNSTHYARALSLAAQTEADGAGNKVQAAEME